MIETFTYTVIAETRVEAEENARETVKNILGEQSILVKAEASLAEDSDDVVWQLTYQKQENNFASMMPGFGGFPQVDRGLIAPEAAPSVPVAPPEPYIPEEFRDGSALEREYKKFLEEDAKESE